MVDVLRYTAFAAEPGGGNPAGVVLDATGLTDDEMLAVADEVGYSETVFVTGGTGQVDTTTTVRYFSPAAEVPFCGHATVALAVVLAERQGPGARTFATAVGDVALDATVDEHGAVQVAMTSVDPASREFDPAPLFTVLGLGPDDIAEGYPVLESFAGNWHPVLVLADRELFHQFRFEPATLAALMRERGWAGTVTVLHPTGPGEYEARNLFPVGRITEDPATGSAAASTGAYLRTIGRAHGGDRVLIRQGRHVGRPSVLLVDVPVSGGITVRGGATRI
jgi:PhzF family phenazine biosynthesis protein